MRKLRHISVLTGVFVIATIFSTTIAVATCEEGEEGFAAVDITPNSYKFESLGTKDFTIKNTGTETIELAILTGTVTKGEPSAFTWSDPNECEGKNLSPGATCVIKITCNQWEAHGSFHVIATKMAGDTSTLNSTP